jgi:NFACT protein C-terminal domain/Heterogeneous nuclear ribonucleoprotein Q acidic domain
MIYGKKNFLPPMPLEMGFGIMFRLDDGSVMRHAGDRKDRSSMSDETESVLSEAASRYGIEFEGLGLREVDTDDEGEGSEAGDADSEGDSEGEGEEEADPSDAGVAAISISAFHLSSIPESDPDQDLDTDEGGDAAPSTNSGVPDVVPRGGAGRLTAKERRLMKAAKVKGGEVKAPIPARTAKKESASKEGVVVNHNLEQDDQDLESEGGDEENEEENESEEERERERERARMTKSDSKNPKGPAPSSSKKGGNNNNNNNNNKSSSQRGGAQGPGSAPLKTPLVGLPPSATNKKKFLNKKKAKRYADQDDDEKELAMLALGHVHVGEVYGEKEEILKKEKEQKDRALRQEKAGIKIVKDAWPDLMALLPPEVRSEVESMVSRGVLKEGEIDGHEIKTLATFSEKDGISVIDLFKDGDNMSKVGNKSGFLAGIMRRFSKDALAAADGAESSGKGSSSSSSSNTGAIEEEELGVNANTDKVEGADGTEESAMSRRERKKKEQQEIKDILEEEGVLDEEEGKQADEINKLTGKPVPEDVLLYAVPVCGPYSAIRSFKYSVKLTPGTMKKGKDRLLAVVLHVAAPLRVRMECCIA